MTIIKCKMCGGDIELSPDRTYGTCDSCGSTMTFPKIDDEQRANAFNRGNYFRRIGEFDKALAVYERIVEEDETDAEAHWCCALCRFGIEYVEDPATHAYLPTCHRASFDSFLEDVDCLAAIKYSDGATRAQYQRDAEKIAEVQRGILATSQTEAPFDVFICYKETDEDGQRTRDSIMAQEIYYQLTEQGRRVFFARITLEDKAGQQYEPYIFAALNSARVMIVVGSSARNFNAVWVKNEWSRFLALMKKDKKKLLLPCYRDMDPYDLPEQLSILQAYDMSKIGFLQDLIRGVNKVLDADKEPEPAHETVVVQGEGTSNLVALLKRGEMSLEDGEWKAANEFFDRALDMDAECAEAWRGKFLARVGAQSMAQHVQNALEALRRVEKATATKAAEPNPARVESAVARFTVPGYLSEADIRALYALPEPYGAVFPYWQEKLETLRQFLYTDRDLRRARSFAHGAFKETLATEDSACASALSAALQSARQRDAEAEKATRDAYAQALNEADRKAQALCKEAETNREAYYQELCRKQAEAKNKETYHSLIDSFKALRGYKDSAERAQQCQERMETLKAQEAEAKREEEYQGLCRKQAEAKRAATFVSLVSAFQNLNAYKDSAERAKQCQAKAEELQALETAEKERAERVHKRNIIIVVLLIAIAAIAAWYITQVFIPAQNYRAAEAAEAEGDLSAAAMMYGRLGDYSNARERSFALWEQVTDRETISADGNHTVGLRSDGTVAAVGENQDGQCEVEDWTDIVAVSAGAWHAVGLKSDGTVVATEYTGYFYDGQCEVEDWTDIVAVSAGRAYTVGLKSDGTVVAVGDNYEDQCEVEDWTDIVAVSAGFNHTVGLKSDGTVVATEYLGSAINYDGQCEVEGWADIVAVSAGGYHTVGLKSDGTVVAVGDNDDGQCDVADWTDIVAVSAGIRHTVGLKSDGTVVAVGYNRSGQCDVADWRDIVAVSAGDDHTVGLKSDGTVVATGSNGYGQYSAAGWTGIKLSNRAMRILSDRNAEAEAHYTMAEELLAAGDNAGAIAEFEAAGSYEDAAQRLLATHYAYAEALLAAGDYEGAVAEFIAADYYSDASIRVKKTQYIWAEALLSAGDYTGAIEKFEALADYSDSEERIQEAHYAYAEALLSEGNYIIAVAEFLAAGDYKDAAERVPQTRYARAEALLEAGDYDAAIEIFTALGDYGDAAQRIPQTRYERAEALLEAGDIDNALVEFVLLGNYGDAVERVGEIHYTQAEGSLAEGDIDNAIAEFALAGDYKDAPERIQAIHYAEAEELLAAGDAAGAAAEFEAAGDYEDAPERALASHYAHAEALLAAGDNDGAATAFEAAGDYEDAPERAQAIRFAPAEAMEAAGNLGAAAILYGQLGDYPGARERSFALWEQVADRETVSAGSWHTVGLKSDGTVVAVGYNDYVQCDAADWTDIVAVSAGWYHTVGLKSDGTVVAVGYNDDGRCGVADWTDIVAVSAGNAHTVGLKSDGTVVAKELTEYFYDGRCDVADWTDIVAVSAGGNHTVGLKSDGTVVAVGDDDYSQCDVADWTDILVRS